MSTEIQKTDKPQLPSLEQLIHEDETSLKQNALTVLLNQSPPDKWLKDHPMAKVKDEKGNNVPAKYLSIDRVEYLLTRIYGKWWVEVRDTKLIANSVCVTIRLFVMNPITGKEEWQDGVGAKDIQTDQGAGAMDWNKAKAAGVMMALPSAESYAIKDAAEKFGKLFGKDVNRQGDINYDSLLKFTTIQYDDLAEQFEQVKHKLDKTELANAKRILSNKEVNSYNKLEILFKSKL